jgi:hypothetical protein
VNIYLTTSISKGFGLSLEKVYIPQPTIYPNYFTGGDRMEGYSGKFLMKIEELERAGSEKALAICCGGYGTVDL